MRIYQNVMEEAATRKDKSRFNPLNIERMFIPGKGQRVYGLIVEAVARKGALHELLETAEKLGIMVPYIQFSMPKSSDVAYKGIAFLDFTDSEAQPEEVLELVKRKKFVQHAEIIKPVVNRVIPDTYFFPLVIADERVVVFRQSVYESLFNGVRREFGSAGEAMLYYEGFQVGLQVYDKYVKLAGTENVKDLVEVAKAINMTLGWGIIDVYKIDKNKGVAHVRVYQNFECEHGKNSEKPYSQFYRGAMAGVFTRFFGKKAKVQEIKCIAKDDPYCEFYVET